MMLKARLFFAIRMMQSLVFFGTQGKLHLVGNHRSMTVLEGPHALEVKKAHAVAILQDVSQIGLETGHGTQPPVDESDSPFLGGHLQLGQQIGHRAPFRKAHL